MKKRVFSIALAVVLALTMLPLQAVTVAAKTIPEGQTVGTTMFYITNSAGQRILVSQTDVSQMEADMEAGQIDQTLHNYSLLDRYVTTVHQEAQGFTAGEYVKYAQSKSTLDSLKKLALTFEGSDQIAFWEMDGSDYDDLDTYTYNDLYGVRRYNFPLLYKYWNYKTQDYYDPDGKMTKQEVIDYIFAHGEPETFLMSVRAFSQRYMLTDEKYGENDYDMENYWQSRGYLDNKRTIRLMVGMTEDELRNATPTASNTRYWVQSVLLAMKKAPDIAPLGSVAAPTATMTSDDDYYYITFSCSTPGATIYYNQNFKNTSYMATMKYTGSAVKVPKSYFRDGTVRIMAHAVRDGCTDAGGVMLTLTVPGAQNGSGTSGSSWVSPYNDVKQGSWYYDYVQFVTQKGYFDSVGSALFGPEEPMTRAMLVTALYRMAGSPAVTGTTAFADVQIGASYADAVLWASRNGVVNGISASEFAPDGSITREQIATMLMRYATYAGKEPQAAASLSGFSDSGQISAYAGQAVSWAVAEGLIKGMTTDTIVPQGTATRAQVAAIVERFAAL